MLHRTPAWETLKDYAQAIQNQRIADFFEAHEEHRCSWEKEACGITLDFSHQLMNSEVLETLLELANSQELHAQFEKMVTGELVNSNDQCSVLHTALRDSSSSPILSHGYNIKPLIHEALFRMEAAAKALPHITDVVNLGIGGSDLGPRLVTQTLSTQHQPQCRCHFLSDTHPEAFQQLFDVLDPETTLILIASKSFTTQVTLYNAKKAWEWIKNPRHVFAITANTELAETFGIKSENILPFWDWVGGRFSVWSAIGFPIVLAHGMLVFREFLAGAHAMDQHVLETAFQDNIPVLLALIGIWNINFLGAQTLAVIPYLYHLRDLTFYVQQLEMESNGKVFTAAGERLPYATAPIIWGTTGLHAQHSYFQALYQGCHPVPVDFITDKNTPIPHSSTLAGFSHKEQFTDTPHNIITLKHLTAFQLGALMAMYEHKVAAQGFLWGINSFDQPGIELAKRLASS